MTLSDASDSFYRHVAQTSEHALGIEISHAEGCYFYDVHNKKYLDFISGIGVSAIGHGHPKVVKAIKEQVDRHLHVMVYGEFIQETQTTFAKKLTDLLPPTLDCVYFTNSGTEANEGALKLAKRHTGRHEIVSFKGSYHGNTQGSLSVSDHEARKSAFRPLLPEVRFIRFNDQKDLRHISERTACVIIEPIQGDAGVRVPDQAFMKRLRKACDDHGALLILDEIQTGFGRTGTMFAFKKFDIIPDILTLGKALGGGLPLGAFVASSSLMKKLTFNPPLGHITTFGGNPVCCAAGSAALDVILEEKLLAGVEKKGALIEGLLKHPAIKEVRREGLMIAVELSTEQEVENVVKGCLDDGLLLFWFLSCKNSFRMAPPLTVSEEEIREATGIILSRLEGHH